MAFKINTPGKRLGFLICLLSSVFMTALFIASGPPLSLSYTEQYQTAPKPKDNKDYFWLHSRNGAVWFKIDLMCNEAEKKNDREGKRISAPIDFNNFDAKNYPKLSMFYKNDYADPGADDSAATEQWYAECMVDQLKDPTVEVSQWNNHFPGTVRNLVKNPLTFPCFISWCFGSLLFFGLAEPIFLRAPRRIFLWIKTGQWNGNDEIQNKS